MKKLLAIVLAVSMLLSLAACDSTNSANASAGGSSGQVVLKMGTTSSAKGMPSRSAENFKAILEEVSGGKMTCDINIASALGNTAQHYAQRLFKRDQTLCAGFAFLSPHRRVYYTGDSGWAKHVAEIGAKFGQFDLVIAENGQYNEDWRHIHMFPEETARALAEVWRARAALPVHSGKFALARHPWYEPFERLSAALAGKGVKLLTPVIGDAVFLDETERHFEPWWRPLMSQRRM